MVFGRILLSGVYRDFQKLWTVIFRGPAKKEVGRSLPDKKSRSGGEGHKKKQAMQSAN
jgi:hypothetical protein